MLAFAVLAGCVSGADPAAASFARSGDTGGDTADPFEAFRMPDFSLQDVNPNSATYGSPVSPRDLLGQISGWYFGHAT